MRSSFFVALFVFLGQVLMAQTSDELHTVQLQATIQANPAQIQLNWEGGIATSGFNIFRKDFDSSSVWGLPLASLGGNDTTWTDTTVVPGQQYQYRVLRQGNPTSGYGYLLSGIEVQLPLEQGRIILAIDTSVLPLNHPLLLRYDEDLRREGWQTRFLPIDRGAAVTDVKTDILAAYNEAPHNTRALALFGHIPVPYSGNIVPDGHVNNHYGAWPSDAYYADLDGLWTDNTVLNTSTGIARINNVPGDGKFDQSVLPSDADLEVGRIDFANLSSFTETETQLMEAYLEKNHAFRTKEFRPRYRGLIENNFATFSEGFGQNGLRNFTAMFGQDSTIYTDYNGLRTESYLWAYACGAGSYSGASGIGNQNGLSNDSLQAVFTMHFGSYFGDWDHPNNNYLRAALASGTILSNSWAGRPNWFYYPMAMGQTLGHCARLAMNNASSYHNSGFSPRSIHIALMGDPTLKMYVTEAPTNLVTNETNQGIELSWDPPTEAVDGYFLYATTLGEDSLVQMGGLLTNPQYTLYPPQTDSTYAFRVCAVQLITSASGSFYQTSPCLWDTITSQNCYGMDTFLVCPPDTVLETPPGSCLIAYNYPLPSVEDDCGNNLDSVLTPLLVTGLGQGGAFAPGLTVEQYGLDQDSCSFNVEVVDPEAPVARCQNLTVSLDANMNAVVVPQQLDDGSSDNCQLPNGLLFSLSQTTFTASDIGPNSVWLIVDDQNGNLDSCQATVTVRDPNVGIEEGKLGERLVLYPQPVHGDLVLRLENKGDCLEQVVVFDMVGRKMMQVLLPGCLNSKVDLGGLAAGTYVIEVQTRLRLARRKITRQ